MKTLIKFNFLILGVFLITSSPVISQGILYNDSTKTELIKAAKDIMNNANTCALITLDKEGRPRVRAMDPFPPGKDLSIWLATNSKSRKVNQIRNDPRITLYYLNNDESCYVMIHGTAILVNSKKEKEKRWKDEWKDFYPENKETYLLIKVSPLWMEISCESRGIYSDTISWQPPTVRLKK